MVIIFVFIQQNVNAKVLLVPQQYLTIQSAIDVSSLNNTFRISPGKYYEKISFKEKAIIVERNGPAESVVIDGSLNNGSVASFYSGETNPSILDGLTITSSEGTSTSNGITGGGILLLDGIPFFD